MCTASWLSEAGSRYLFFNRDELRTREAALPPRLESAAGRRWLAPRDGRAGGTWIAASESGLALALLNKSGGRAPELPESRGRIIPRLLGAASADRLTEGVLALGLERYAPFRLLALWREPGAAVALAWDGSRLEREELDPAVGLLCSSGLGDERATQTRGALWQRRRSAAGAWGEAHHRAFHRDHEPEPSAWSVCVHRPEACTVSYTEIELSPLELRVRYRPGSPCLEAPFTEVRLPLGSSNARARA